MKFLIGYNFGLAGSDTEYEIEADSLEEAEQIAWDSACERVSSWAKLIEEDE